MFYSTRPALIDDVLDELLLIAAKSLLASPTSQSQLLFVRPKHSLSSSHHQKILEIVVPNLPWCSIDTASGNGNSRALAWWFELPASCGRPLNYSNVALDSASAAGHVAILDMWFASNIPLKYTAAATDAASANGKLAVLDRWHQFVHRAVSHDLAINDRPLRPSPSSLKASNVSRPNGQMELLHTETAVNLASKNGHLHVLEYWLHLHQSELLPLKFTYHAINWACLNGHRSVVAWWKNCLDHGHLKCSLNFAGLALAAAIANNPVGLELWREFDLSPITCTPLYISFAAEKGAASVLAWWLHCFGSSLEYDQEAIDLASAYGRLDVLQWFADSGLDLKYSTTALDSAIRSGNQEVVSWWKGSGLEIKSQLLPSSGKKCFPCSYL